jgi:3-deoxy-7-phosphoheptulonate synthase
MSQDTPQPPVPSDRTSLTDDERIQNVTPLPSPEDLIRSFPIERSSVEGLVTQTRRRIRDIIHGRSDRLLIVLGPCSIHDPEAAVDYAKRLVVERGRLAADLEIVMRVYFEKPRTTVGWKGLINDPFLDGSFQIREGLRIARHLLLRINHLGVPAGSEFLDTISPQYIGDLISWGAIGARTTESQVHRELASGLSAPIGFKNGTDGNVKIAIDAILAARQKHHFLSIHKNGQVAIVETSGNDDCHIILRGGKAPNYDARSQKNHERQILVAGELASQIASGERRIFGVMIESALKGGRQDIVPGRPLVYGQSVTDACISWDDTVPVLETLAQAVRDRRRARPQAVPLTEARERAPQ